MLTKADLIATIWQAYFPTGENPESGRSIAFIRRQNRLSKPDLIDLAVTASKVLDRRFRGVL